MSEADKSERFPGRTLADRLWNPAVGAGSYSPAGADYHSAVLEQYKLYVEMADRISSRRSLTNTFFLTLNTAMLTVAGAFGANLASTVPTWGVVLVVLVAISQCGAWFLLIASYKRLNAAKYKVIGELEQRLPALPFRDGEWFELGEGRRPDRYVPLTRIEAGVPAAFAALYAVGALLFLLAR